MYRLLTDNIMVKELMVGDLIVYFQPDFMIYEVICLSGLTLIFKNLFIPSHPEEEGKIKLWNLKNEMDTLVEIIKQNPSIHSIQKIK